MLSFEDVFAACKSEGRPAYIPYITAGFPTRGDTVPAMLAMEKAGADIIEVRHLRHRGTPVLPSPPPGARCRLTCPFPPFLLS